MRGSSVRIRPREPSFAKASDDFAMYYVYILQSENGGHLYTGWTPDLKRRLAEHNAGQSRYTKAYAPWRVIYYSAFETEKLAKEFEKYLKTGSGKAFLYKRLILKSWRKIDS